jgi:hypothetical protein
MKPELYSQCYEQKIVIQMHCLIVAQALKSFWICHCDHTHAFTEFVRKFVTKIGR